MSTIKLVKMKKSLALLLILLFFTSLVTTHSFTVKAQTKTILVPDNYPTISSAIKNATDGDVIFVKSGTYNESTLLINKSISLIGQNALVTTIILNPRYIEVNSNLPFEYSQASHFEDALDIQATDVTISGLTFKNSQGEGNTLISGNGDRLINNVFIGNSIWLSSFQVFAQNKLVNSGITLFGSNTTITANIIENGEIYVGVGSENVAVCSNALSGYGGIGILGSSNTIFNNTVVDSFKGIVTDGPEASDNIVCANVVSNCSIGLEAFTEKDNNIFFANEVTNNTYGANVAEIFDVGNNLIFYGNNFIGNTYQVNTNSTVKDSHNAYWILHHGGIFDNGNKGNYWSDYKGTDANEDSIGDSPYVIDSNRSDSYPLVRPFDLSSIEFQLPDWVNNINYSIPIFPQEIIENRIEQTATFSMIILVVALVVVVGFIVSLLFYRRNKKPLI